MYWLKCNLLSRIVIHIYPDSDNFEKELVEQEIVIVNREAATFYNMLAACSQITVAILKQKHSFQIINFVQFYSFIKIRKKKIQLTNILKKHQFNKNTLNNIRVCCPCVVSSLTLTDWSFLPLFWTELKAEFLWPKLLKHHDYDTDTDSWWSTSCICRSLELIPCDILVNYCCNK